MMKHKLGFLLFMLIISLNIFTQERTISGVITTPDGETLENVKVIAPISAVEAFSNEQGYYEITVPEKEDELEYFLKDMIKSSVSIGLQDEINITMASVGSDDIFDISLEDLMNMEVTTASKKAEKSSDAPGLLTVVSKDEIERFGGNSLGEILDRIVTSYGLSNHLVKSLVSIRGDQTTETSSHLLVLINGRPTRERVWGGTDADVYQSFPVSAIDHIEVVRGPGSVLYGTNAFTGVINIITKQEDHTYLEANGMGIAEGGYGGDITANVAKGDFQVFGSIRYITKPSFDVDYEAFDRGIGTFTSQPYSSTDTSMGAFIGVNFKNASAMFAYTDWETTTDNSYRYKRSFGDIGYKFDIIDNWEIDVNGTFTSFDQESFVNRYSTEVLGELTNHLDLSDDLSLLIGGSYTYINGKEEANFGAEPEVSMDSTEGSYIIYSQIQYQVLSNLKLIAGFQYNKVENLGGDIVPRFGLIYYPIEKLNIKALYAQSYRAPSLDEKYLNDGRLQGNELLLPEKVNSLDLSVTWLGDNFQSSLSYFMSLQNNLIAKSGSTFGNVDNLTLQGFELENKYYLNKNIFFTLNSSYLISEQDSLKNVTPIPLLMIKFGASYVSNNGISISLFNIYNGDYADDNIFNNVTTNQQYTAHNLLNIHANFELNKLFNLNIHPEFNIYIHGENILDTQVWNVDYIEDPTGDSARNIAYPPQLGRMTYVGLKVKF